MVTPKVMKTVLLALLVLTSGEAFAATQSSASQSPKQYSDIGYGYVAQERYAEAVDAFQKALSAGRNQFTLDERVRMAVYISWENRLDVAIDELQRVLSLCRSDAREVVPLLHSR